MIKWYENKKENLNKEIIPNFKLKEFRCKCGKCNLTANTCSENYTRSEKMKSECAKNEEKF